jgi:hypothetical protein
MTRNKYNARKVTIDGIQFDSQAEARRYGELKLLERAGEISDLQCHPRFRLLDGMDWNGKHYRAVNFAPDFQYQENGKAVVEDVKGGKATQTGAFKLRMKLWINQHDPDKWEFRIVE